MTTAKFKTTVDVPVRGENWECPFCHDVLVPLAMVNVNGSTGEGQHPGNNHLNAKEVRLDLQGKVLGIYLPGHVCLAAPSQEAALTLGHLDKDTGKIL